MLLAMTSRTSSTVISVIGFLGLSSALFAQRAKPPSLEEILRKLEANLNHYDTRLPSLFCDEHVISQAETSLHNQSTVIDSVFRLKRTQNSDHTTTLVEQREIKTVNGKPATKQDMDGPTLLNGMFEGGLAAVSLSQAACTNYSLQRIDSSRPTAPYIVRFDTVLTPQNSANCLFQEDSKGRAFIDPASMQLTHLEVTTPHHVIVPGTAYTSSVVGKRILTVDYASVVLDGETFWMPTTITMHATSGSGTFHMMVWSFHATYSNYHKLQVTSRILPGSGAPAP
jgi:hypothetical protein